MMRRTDDVVQKWPYTARNLQFLESFDRAEEWDEGLAEFKLKEERRRNDDKAKKANADADAKDKKRKQEEANSGFREGKGKGKGPNSKPGGSQYGGLFRDDVIPKHPESCLCAPCRLVNHGASCQCILCDPKLHESLRAVPSKSQPAPQPLAPPPLPTSVPQQPQLSPMESLSMQQQMPHPNVQMAAHGANHSNHHAIMQSPVQHDLQRNTVWQVLQRQHQHEHLFMLGMLSGGNTH